MSGDMEKIKFSRKDFFKAAATTPVLGAFGYAVVKKKDSDTDRRRFLDQVKNEVIDKPLPTKGRKATGVGPLANDTINIGFIGVGSRGSDHMRSLGFRVPEELEPGQSSGEEIRKELNIRCTAVCDLFQPRLETAVRRTGGTAKIYHDHRELLASSDVDAVVIATTDHWHAPIATAAAEAGKHVYVEKCMTHDLQQAYILREAVKRKGVVLQLGHQNRNSTRFESAQKVIASGILGDVTLVQCFTNRNSNDGAWFRGVPKPQGPLSAAGGPRNVDWKQYISNTTDRPYDPNRFFNWSCYWDYSTGLSGQLLTHEIDVINMILSLGLPTTAMASGGIYHYKDYQAMMTADGTPLGTDEPLPPGARPRPDVPLLVRECPDVYQVVYEWKDRGLTVVYNATLANSFPRGQIYMGNEATMDLSHGVNIFADPNTKRYAELLKSGEVTPTEPMLTFRNTSAGALEAVTSATARWTNALGLTYDIRNGKRVDLTLEHHKNWLAHVRAGDQHTLCDIDAGFQEAITTNMSVVSYKSGCRVRWDAELGKVVPDSDESKVPDVDTKATNAITGKTRTGAATMTTS